MVGNAGETKGCLRAALKEALRLSTRPKTWGVVGLGKWVKLRRAYLKERRKGMGWLTGIIGQ